MTDAVEIAPADTKGPRILWQPQPVQERALQRSENEIYMGGAKGGGKSDCQIIFMGQFAFMRDRAGKVMYPGYRGLVVRVEAQYLQHWIDRATELYGPLGGRAVGRPVEFRFRGGPILRTGHLEDKDAWTKYHGQSIHKLGLDEINQIPSEENYLLLTANLRNSPDGNPQVFATGNPGNVGDCVPHGEVLTPQGWKDIRDFRVGDRVCTVLESGALGVSLVDQVHRKNHSGHLVSIKAGDLRVLCTPTHRVAKVGGRHRDKMRKFSLVTVDDLPGQATILRTVEWEGQPLGDFTVPDAGGRARKNVQPRTITARQYAELLGWYLSEGCCVDRDKAFGIAQIRTPGRKTIRRLLEECGFKASWSDDGCVVYAPDWWAHFRQFGKAHEKHVPLSIKNSDRETLRAFFDAAVAGDGHWVRTGLSGCYYTVSKRMADDMCEIALKLGYVVSVGERKKRSKNWRPCLEVFFKTVKSGGTELLTGNHVYNVGTSTKRKSKIERVPFDGEVFCIGVRHTHNFIIRQNGSVWVSGNSWVKKRWVKVYSGGKLVPPGKSFRDPITRRTRIFIPAFLQDNQELLNKDPGYRLHLEGLPEAKKRAWLYGDWDAFEGQFFPEWRPNGPIGDEEPKWARHCAEPREFTEAVHPWSYRWISMDWGYAHPSAVYWSANGEDGRVYTYREYVTRQTGSFQMGVEIAKRSLSDLQGLSDPRMILYLSPDAFGKEDEAITRADQIRDGINAVLGSGAAFVLHMNDDELALRNRDAQAAHRSFEQRREDAQSAAIQIQKANWNRPDGWDYMREMMRWRPTPALGEPDMNYVAELLQRYSGELLAKQYLDRFQNQKRDSALPKWRVVREACPFLVESIPLMQHDPNKPEDMLKRNATDGNVDGDDCVDSLRYNLLGHKAMRNDQPLGYFMEGRISVAREQGINDPTVLAQVARHAERRYEREHSSHSGSMNFPRMGSMRHWSN